MAIYPAGDSKALANHLNALLASPERLRAAKLAALSAAENIFCWERQAPALLQSVEKAFMREAEASYPVQVNAF